MRVNPVLDDILVAAALLASVVYALFSLGPKSVRRRALSYAAGWALRTPARLGLRGLGTRLGAAATKASGACGGCDSCGSDAAAPGTPTGDSDIKIPLSRIGRRR